MLVIVSREERPLKPCVFLMAALPSSVTQHRNKTTMRVGAVEGLAYEERRLENVLAARALTSPGDGLMGVWREIRELVSCCN